MYSIRVSLTPSQRIRLIREISERLGSERWALIDLTLKQFGLPSADQWSGAKDEYVLDMIQGAKDQPLILLAQHLGFDSQIPQKSGLEPSFWRKGFFRLFITHLAKHKRRAGELQEALLEYGITGFVAHNDIEPTSEWQNQIETALSTCDALVALLHEKFHESKWTDQEIGFAMGRGVPVFAVRFGEDPYGFIGRFQAFDGNSTPAESANKLCDAYSKNKQTKKRMSEALVTLFEESASFAEAKRRIGLLENLSDWESSLAARVGIALESNSQISRSYGVPEKVERLIKKWV